MDASKPIGEDIFRLPTHTTTPAGDIAFTHDDDDDGGGDGGVQRSHIGAVHAVDDLAMSGAAIGTAQLTTPSGRPAPGTKLAKIVTSSPSMSMPPHSAAFASSSAPSPSLHMAGTSGLDGQLLSSWPPAVSAGAAAAAAYAVSVPDDDAPPPPLPPKTHTIHTAMASPYASSSRTIPIPPLPASSSQPHLLQGHEAHFQPGSTGPHVDLDRTPVAALPPFALPLASQPPSRAADVLASPQGVATTSLALEPPSYASLGNTQDAPPTFAQASATGAPAPAQGGRFPRWRGWLEKRDLERRYAAMEEAAQAAAEGRPARKRSWGAGVHDADALPYDDETDDDLDDDEEDEEQTDDTGDDDTDDDVEDEAAQPDLVNLSASSTKSTLPPFTKKRRRDGPPPPLHSHHFGSRFLPHLPSQPLCAVFLDIPPKPSTPTLAVATAPTAMAEGGAGPSSAGVNRLWTRTERPRPPPPRRRSRPPQRRTVILVGTASGLYAVELARPRRAKHGRRDGPMAGGNAGADNLSGAAESAPLPNTSSANGLGMADDTEDQESGWNGGIRVVQVWSGMGIFQLSILRSRPPPSAMFGPDGVTVPPPPRKGYPFMGGGGFAGLGGAGSSTQGPGQAAKGAILLALTAPAPASETAAPPLTRVSPCSHSLLESSVLAHHGERIAHHHHHARTQSLAPAHEEGRHPSNTMNLSPNVAPGSFGADSGGGPGRAVPTTSSSLAAHVAGLPGGVGGIGASEAPGAAAAAAATLASLTSAGTGAPTGQVRMWNLEAVRGCVAWALDNQQPCEPLDLLSSNGSGTKKTHKHTRNRLSRAFKKVLNALGEGNSTGRKVTARPGLSDSLSMDAVETLASVGAATKHGKGKDRAVDERRKKMGQRTGSDGSGGWTLVEEPTPRSELDLDPAGQGGVGGYEESVRSQGTYGCSFDEERGAPSPGLPPLSPDVDRVSMEAPAPITAAEASRRAALRLALSSIVIPAGSGGGNAPGTLPGPTIPPLDDERSGATGKKMGGAALAGASSTGTPGTHSSGIGPATGGTGSPKPALFYAVHEAAPGSKGAGTWYLALATTKTITVYEARPPPHDQQRTGSSFLPLSFQRGGAGGGQAWAPNGPTSPGGGGGGGGESRSWSLLRELYTPQAPKAIAFAQASTTDIPLSAKERGAGMHHHHHHHPPDSVLKPQFAGGMAGPRAWRGADLSLLVTFGHRAVIIRLTDLNVRDFDLAPTAAAMPSPVLRQRTSAGDACASAVEDEVAKLTADLHGTLSVRPAAAALSHNHHHRRGSSSSLLSNVDDKHNWVGMQAVDVKIILRQSRRPSEGAGTMAGVPMSASLSAGAEAHMGPGREQLRDADPTRAGASAAPLPTPVFASVLIPTTASEQGSFVPAGAAPPLQAAPPLPIPSRPASSAGRSESSSASTATLEDEDEDSLVDDDDEEEEEGNRSEIIYTAQGRPAVLLNDRAVRLSAGSRSDPTLGTVGGRAEVSAQGQASERERRGAPTTTGVSGGGGRRRRRRRRREVRREEASSPGKLVSTSIALVSKGVTTQILPLPLPADLCKPRPLDVMHWGGVPNAVSGWARVVGLERERTTGGTSTALLGTGGGKVAGRLGGARRTSSDEASHSHTTTTSSSQIILHLNVTALAFMASRVEMQRRRVRMRVSLGFALLRDAEMELLPILDAVLPPPVPTAVKVKVRSSHDAAAVRPADGETATTTTVKMKTNPQAYALGMARANDMCVCADPPPIGSHSSTFDASRRPSLSEPQLRRQLEFEYLGGLLVGVPQWGGVRPASVAALDVCRPWEMRGDGGVLAWDWRGGRDYRLFFVGAEV